MVETRGKVLVVGADRDLCQRLIMALEDEFEVVVALDVASARLAQEKFSFDVLIADYPLPDGNGLHLIDEALEAHPNLSAILLLSPSHAIEAQNQKHYGRFVVLTKPFRTQALLDWVKNNAATTQLVRILHKIKQVVEELGHDQ